MVARLGRAMQFAITFTEAERASDDPDDARALIYKGWAAHFSAAARGIEAENEARSYFEQALKLRPENARAKLGLAASFVSISVRDFSEKSKHDLAHGERLLQEVAAELPRSYGVYFYSGIAQRARGKLNEAVQSFERAIELNPSHAASYAHMGFVLTRLGQASKGLEQIQYAMRLGPKDPTMPLWLIYKGFAELELERDQPAIESFRQARTLNPRNISSYAGLAAALALSGKMEDASLAIAELQKAAPHFSHERILTWFLGPRGNSNLRMVRGLRFALNVAP
jgi:tetratricopeptide (TPR) repeat protein